MSSPDKLTIDTPEQTSLEFPLAGIGSRFLAMLADRALQIVIVGVLVAIAAVSFPILIGTKAFAWAATWGPQWAIALFILGYFLIDSGYFAFFESIWNGQTPGKRYAKIRVIKDDGRPITTYDAVARNLLRVVDEIPAIYGVGMLSILLSNQNKRLGDYVAGTVVIHEKAVDGARPFLEKQAEGGSGPVYDVSRVTIDEMRLMEMFFQRRDSFEPALRTSMAAQIATRIGQTLDVQVLGWPQTERFIEAVYEQFRSAGRLRS